MKEILEVIVKIVGLIWLPCLIVGYGIWGILRGIYVWSWNINHSKLGDWKVTLPQK